MKVCEIVKTFLLVWVAASSILLHGVVVTSQRAKGNPLEQMNDPWVTKTFAMPPKHKLAKYAGGDEMRLAVIQRESLKTHLEFESMYFRYVRQVKVLRDTIGPANEKLIADVVAAVAGIGKSRNWKDIDAARPIVSKEAKELMEKECGRAYTLLSEREEMFATRGWNKQRRIQYGDEECINPITGLPVNSTVIAADENFFTYKLPDGTTKMIRRPKDVLGRPVSPNFMLPVARPGQKYYFNNPKTDELISHSEPDTRTKRQKNQDLEMMIFNQRMRELSPQTWP